MGQNKASRRDFLFKSTLSGLGLGLMSNNLFAESVEKEKDLLMKAPLKQHSPFMQVIIR